MLRPLTIDLMGSQATPKKPFDVLLRKAQTLRIRWQCALAGYSIKLSKTQSSRANKSMTMLLPVSPSSSRYAAVRRFAAYLLLGIAGANNGTAAAYPTANATFGLLSPGAAPSQSILPIRLAVPASLAGKGYKILAVGDFNFSASAPAAGGASVSAGDIGLGVALSSEAVGNAAIGVSEGFGYDPLTGGASGRSSYPGAAKGRANFADLLTTHEIVRVGKHAVSEIGSEELIVILKLATQPQFLTPGKFSGTITLIVSDLGS